MNVYPADTEVRQGLEPAGNTGKIAAENSAIAGAKQQTVSQQNQSAEEAQSEKVAATADKTEARAAAQKINDQLQASNTKLKIRVLDNTDNGVQVEIVNTQSNKVVRKIPQDELLKLSASIKQMTGVVLNQPA